MKSFIQRHTGMFSTGLLTSAYVIYTMIFTDGVAGDLFSSIIRLFVPVGGFITLFTYGTAPVVFIVVLFFFDNHLHKINLPFHKRILLTFVLLFVATTVFDLIVFKDSVSLKYFLDALGLIYYRGV